MISTKRIKPSRPTRHLMASVLALGLLSAPVSAATPLAEEQHINYTLISAAIGEAIRTGCPTISARIFRVLNKAKALERYAIKLGYSEKEIKDFIASPKERTRVREAAKAYLIKNGVVAGQEETYCKLGRAEIAKGTLTGTLLWSWN